MSIAAPERYTISGEAGAIEALIEYPDTAFGSPRAVAVCCHPHPLFGGAMTNKVIHTVARSFVAAGAITLRFNFRGVGGSAGVHDEGRGELRDLQVVVEWLQQRWPQLPLWLGGFSFGAWMVLRAQGQLNPALLVTVAPPVGRWDFSEVMPPVCPWLTIQGTRDELVDAGQVSAFVKEKSSTAECVLLQDADHFFHARLHEVRDAIERFIKTQPCSE